VKEGGSYTKGGGRGGRGRKVDGGRTIKNVEPGGSKKGEGDPGEQQVGWGVAGGREEGCGGREGGRGSEGWDMVGVWMAERGTREVGETR